LRHFFLREISRRAAVNALALSLLLAAGLSPSDAAAATKKPATKKKETKVSKSRDYAKTLAILKTTQGDITLKFYFDKAPEHVKNFIDLAAAGFYDGTLFHRVIPEFMIQGGDPLTQDPKISPALYGTGNKTDTKGRAVNVKAEFTELSHKRGILSMARGPDPNSASSQYFIVVKDSPFLDRQYSVFGEVVKGMEIADKIVSESRPDISDRFGGKPTVYQKLLKVELSEDTGAR
jgi:peptidyl-prolyl cis-trans isomerase B (cyclophilin B)